MDYFMSLTITLCNFYYHDTKTDALVQGYNYYPVHAL